jgi:hypothetical protein
VITARALGVYVYLQATGANISAEGLSSVFPEGREAIAKSLRELRDAGLIETKKARINGRIMTVSHLVETDYWAPETRVLSQQSQLNSYKSLIAYSYISKPNSEQGSREVKMEYFETEEDRLDAQRKWREKKHAEKMEAHESRRRVKMLRRNPLNAISWSPTDSSFEFAEQMHDLWHIQPWQVTRSRFRYALDAKRKEFNTNGAIELQMMKLFFSQIKHDTKLADPEIVWKRFIVQFHNLLAEVNRSTVTPEKMEAIKEKSTRSLDWMDDV